MKFEEAGIEASIAEMMISSSEDLQSKQTALASFLSSPKTDERHARHAENSFNTLVDATWVVYGHTLAGESADSYVITDKDHDLLKEANGLFDELVALKNISKFQETYTSLNKIIHYLKVIPFMKKTEKN